MKKKYFIIFFIVLFCFLLAGALWYFRTKYIRSNNGRSLPSLERNLSAEQEQIYKDRLTKGQDYLKSIDSTSPGASQEKAQTYIYLGQQYFGLGDLEHSKDMYDAALQVDPKNEQALVGLSVTLSEAKDFTGAASALEETLQNNPLNFDAWLRYIAIKKDLGTSTQDLKGLYDQALEKTNQYVDILTSYAKFEESVGDFNLALSLWEQAKSKNPNGSELYDLEISRLKQLQK